MKVVRKTIKKSKKNICPCMQKNASCEGVVRWRPNPLAVSEAKVPHYTNTILGFSSMMGLKEGETVGDLIFNFSKDNNMLNSDNVPAQLLSENGMDEIAVTSIFENDSKLLDQVKSSVSGLGSRFQVAKVLGMIPSQVTKKVFGNSVTGMVFVVKMNDTSRPIQTPEGEEKKYQTKIVAVSSNPAENSYLENWLGTVVAPKAEAEFKEDNNAILKNEIKKEIEKKKREISTLREVLLKAAKGTNFIKDLDNLEVTNVPFAELVEAKIPGCDFSYILKVTFEGKVYDPKAIRTPAPAPVKLVVAPTKVEQKA